MKKPAVIVDEFYSVAEASQALGVDRRTLLRWTRAGHIRCHIRRCDSRTVYSGKDILDCYYDVF